ncbi:hypothetical protein BDZ45DRAFT_684142 [Acephala macrosclerotiorum]|nr:hypothetical protein BDZ45DRAFT_684142 [Acephala macrosclerotiorum]
MSDWSLISNSESRNDSLSPSPSEDGFEMVARPSSAHINHPLPIKNVTQWLESQSDFNSIAEQTRTGGKVSVSKPIYSPKLLPFTLEIPPFLKNEDIDHYGLFALNLNEHPDHWYEITVARRLYKHESGENDILVNTCIASNLKIVKQKFGVPGLLQLALWSMLYKKSFERKGHARLWFWKKIEEDVSKLLDLSKNGYIVLVRSDHVLIRRELGCEEAVVDRRRVIMDNESYFVIDGKKGAYWVSYRDGRTRMREARAVDDTAIEGLV